MDDSIQVAEQISIRASGKDERWLQDLIWNDPSILGLGDLEGVQKERRQPTGGRLDILLKRAEDDTMFEVEIMLGETDETHIVRTIEYWDAEKRRWPQRQHKAVIVAEHINRRFFNVIHLLSHSIPIIAIQANLLRVGNASFVNFTKVLDTFQEIDDGTDSDSNRADRSTWIKKSPSTLQFAEKMLEVSGSIRDELSLIFTNYYIAISGKKNFIFFRPRRHNSCLIEFRINEESWPPAEELLQNAGFAPQFKEWSFVVQIPSVDMITKQASAFESTIGLSYYLSERQKKSSAD
ncbi:hypothetical protein [Brucella anthropi]|uniref:hypothetical protein n=1 Tax=Brucella anthropi TaxID=529 RepID=UPI00077506FE|nr:hypothetical protein [Brucella anthropi]KXO77719.1 hypothetical protein AYJ56_19685 [Brucella anthropi]